MFGHVKTQIHKYKRGYVQAGKYTPEAACEHPGAVRQLALEFARAGGDVTQTFTYGSTEGKMKMMMAIQNILTPRIRHSCSCSVTDKPG